jgi:hypothetical protein
MLGHSTFQDSNAHAGLAVSFVSHVVLCFILKTFSYSVFKYMNTGFTVIFNSSPLSLPSFYSVRKIKWTVNVTANRGSYGKLIRKFPQLQILLIVVRH